MGKSKHSIYSGTFSVCPRVFFSVSSLSLLLLLCHRPHYPSGFRLRSLTHAPLFPLSQGRKYNPKTLRRLSYDDDSSNDDSSSDDDEDDDSPRYSKEKTICFNRALPPPPTLFL
jgi:hypothetical protein